MCCMVKISHLFSFCQDNQRDCIEQKNIHLLIYFSTYDAKIVLIL